jgi:hypothetical protein
LLYVVIHESLALKVDQLECGKVPGMWRRRLVPNLSFRFHPGLLPKVSEYEIYELDSSLQSLGSSAVSGTMGHDQIMMT